MKDWPDEREANELTTLRIIVDAIVSGDYESDPATWRELAKATREYRHDWRTTQVHESAAGADIKWSGRTHCCEDSTYRGVTCPCEHR